MAYVLLSFLLNRLSTFLVQESAHLGGLRQGLQFNNDELGTIRAFLRDVEAQDEKNNERLREWVKQVREAAYEIEDVIDECMLIFPRTRIDGLCGRLQNSYTAIKTLKARHRFSSKINDIKSRVEHISSRYQRYKSDYGFHGTVSTTAAEDRVVHNIRQRALFLEEAELVGIDVPKKQLLSQILDDNSHLRVVSVVGMGGMGKTTLVRRVYEDSKVKREFRSHAWVTISQTFNIVSTLKDLIRRLHHQIKESLPPEVESKDVDGLKVFLRGFLREKRYIIIFDDIWSTHAWEDLIYALPDSNCGSRVMLTTRIADVASASCHQHGGYVHRMKALSDEESWTLFCNKSFEDKCCPLHLQDISKRILKKCGHLPLAIVSIGGLLFLKDKNSLDEWENVHSSLGGELEGTGKLNPVNRILFLAYNDLSYHLKACLLYTCLYPEDYRIQRRHLIRLWISEGLVEDREGMSSIDVAKEYMNELVNRNLLQVQYANPDGSIERCCFHDLVREVILSKAKEHGIVTVVRGRCTNRSDNARRLVIQDFHSDAQEDIQYRHFRSLLMFGYGDHISTSSFLKSLCGRSNLLKVLSLDQLPLENIPEEVFKLFHLKYLGLIRSKVKVIPKSIKNLQNLEFLLLGDSQVTELRPEILKLGKLRDLRVFQSGDYSSGYANRGFRAPSEIGRLSSLECLWFINADNENIVREIGKLRQLRELGVTKLRREDGKRLCSSLEKLTNLRMLQVVSISEDEILDLQHSMSTIPQFLQSLELEGRLDQLPHWLPSLQGLTTLGLYGSGLMEDQLECLRMLPNLHQLILRQAYQGEKLCFKAGGFRKLKKLILERLKRLRCVIIEEGAMPHLKKLDMTGCELVDGLPQGIQHLSELQKLELLEMPKELIAELENGNKEESENYRKIAHVPEIHIGNRRNGKWYGHVL